MSPPSLQPPFVYSHTIISDRSQNVSAFYSNLSRPLADEAEQFHFDYGVLEVKLQGEGPAWLAELMAKGWLQEMSFSKFQHTLAVNYPDLVSSLSHSLFLFLSRSASFFLSVSFSISPYFSVSVLSLSLFFSHSLSRLSVSLSSRTISPRFSLTHFQVSINPAWISILEEAARNEARLSSADLLGDRAVTNSGLSDVLTTVGLDSNVGTAATAAATKQGSLTSNQQTSAAVVGAPPSQSGPPPPPPAASDSSKAATRPSSLNRLFNRSSKSPARTSVRKEPPKEKPKAVIAKLKVEPKTFFANERTFLKWMQLSVLLVTLSTGLLAVNDSRARLAGTLFFPIAIAFVAYAMLLFLWRVRVLLYPSVSGKVGRFDEPYGPTIFGIAVMAALMATLILVWVPLNYNDGIPLGITVTESPNCMTQSAMTLSAFSAFQVPTALAVVVNPNSIVPVVTNSTDNFSNSNSNSTTGSSDSNSSTTITSANSANQAATIMWIALTRKLLMQSFNGSFSVIHSVSSPLTITSAAVLSYQQQRNTWVFLIMNSASAFSQCTIVNATGLGARSTCTALQLAGITSATAMTAINGYAYLATSSTFGLSLFLSFSLSLSLSLPLSRECMCVSESVDSCLVLLILFHTHTNRNRHLHCRHCQPV